MGKKATTAETKPDNISRQDKSDCGKDAQEEGRQAGRTLGPGGARTGVWAAQSLCLRLYNICFTMISFLTA